MGLTSVLEDANLKYIFKSKCTKKKTEAAEQKNLINKGKHNPRGLSTEEPHRGLRLHRLLYFLMYTNVHDDDM